MVEKINTLSLNENELVVSSLEELEKVTDLIHKGETFILVGKKSNRVIVGSTLSSKVESGELILRSVKGGF